MLFEIIKLWGFQIVKFSKFSNLHNFGNLIIFQICKFSKFPNFGNSEFLLFQMMNSVKKQVQKTLSKLKEKQNFNFPDAVITTLILFLLSKSAISASFLIIYPFAGELYPTQLRGVAIGFSAYISGLGLIIIPFITYLVSLKKNSLIFTIVEEFVNLLKYIR